MASPAAALPDRGGTYVVMLESAAPQEIVVGRLGTLCLAAGTWLYVGSAFGPGGLRARVTRHCRAGRRRHWHLDYLDGGHRPRGVWYSRAATRLEHRWARALAADPRCSGVARFGASDCDCPSHFFQCTAGAAQAVVGALPARPRQYLAL